MFALLSSLLRLLLSGRDVREIALENLVLRQQLAVMKRRCPRPRLRRADRLFWVWLSRIWPHWRKALLLVRPETVVGWHPGDLHRLAAAVAPKRLIPIHTFERHRFPDLFGNVTLVDDGQWIEV